jgi:two-component system, LytTR family, sensor kinase
LLSSLQKHRLIGFGAIVLIWGLVAVFTTTQWYMIDLSYSQSQPWHRYFGPSLLANMLWAAFTPGIVMIAGKVGFIRGQALRFFGLHLCFGVCVAVSHTVIYVLLLHGLFGGDQTIVKGTELLFRKLATSFQVNLLIYATITGLAVAGAFLRSLRRGEIEGAQLMTELAQAQTQALRAQLQPHFLFNALNAIAAQVRDEPLKAERMIARLGDLLRLSIDGQRGQECTLAEELDLTDAYLAIEEVRLEDRLEIERQISAEALKVRVPSLLLQPLVENAVRHGIAPSLSGGRLKLVADIDGSDLCIIIADNGVGAAQVSKGMGLGHTRQRLERHYGARQSLDIDTAPGQGFRITIRLPA